MSGRIHSIPAESTESFVESIEIPDILTDLNIIFNDYIKILETILSQIPI